MQMPVLFVGHGSPMNIIADNTYTRSMQDLPMLYAVALQEPSEELRFCCNDIQNGSISIRSFVIGS